MKSIIRKINPLYILCIVLGVVLYHLIMSYISEPEHPVCADIHDQAAIARDNNGDRYDAYLVECRK